MDWTPLEQAAMLAAASIMSASAAVAAAYIRSHVKNQAVAAELVSVETFGAGVAHDTLTSLVNTGRAVDWETAKSAAVQAGLAAAQKRISSVTEDDVRARLAPLLAVDASVPAGNAATASASSGGGGGSAAALAEAPK